MSAIVGALRAILSLESAAFTKGLSQAQLDLKRFDKQMKDLGSKMQKVGLALEAVGAGIAASLKSSLNYADDMGKAAQKFGVPVEELSRLAHAADLSDVSMETLGTALKQLSVRMANSASSFKDIGVSVRDMNGNLRPTQDVLADVADVIAGMPDGAQKTALAVRLLGKSGADMIPMLNGGGQALRDMAAEADAMGLTISGDTVKAAETFNDNLTRLWGTLRGLSVEIMAALAPAMEELSAKAVEIAGLFQDLSPKTQAWLAAIAGLVVVSGPALVALGMLVSSLGTLRAVLAGITAMMLANPIVLGVLAIAGAAALIYVYWEPIKQFFVDLWDTIRTKADATWQAIKDSALATRDWVLEKWDGLKAEFDRRLDQVRQAFDELWPKIKALTVQWVNDFLQLGQDIVDGLQAGIQKKWDEMVAWFAALSTGWINSVKGIFDSHSPSRVFADIGRDITDGLALGLEGGVPTVQTAMDGVTEAVAGAGNGLTDALQGAYDWGKTTFSGLLTGVTTVTEALENLRLKLLEVFSNQAWDYLWGALFGGTGGVAEGAGLLSPLLSAQGNVFQSGRLAAFAKGGVVTGPLTFPMQGGVGVMGEAGPEAIMPLTRGSDGRLGVQALGGAGQVIVQQTIQISAGVAQTVRAEVMGLMPVLREQAIQGVIAANRRGGLARRGLA